MKNIAELEMLDAIETEAGFDIQMDGETLVTVEQLNVSKIGQPRFKIINHVWQGLPRLDCTYRKIDAVQFVYWYGNVAKLATLIMATLLSSPWNN
jgi:hypothetical protein